MDPALEGISDAPDTAQSSGAASSGGATSTNTAEFGIRDGWTIDDDCPSGATQGNVVTAAPAITPSPTVERGRSRRPERSSISTSIRITTTHDATIKSKSKSGPPTTVRAKGDVNLTADELLDKAIAEANKKAGRIRTTERTMMAVEDNPQLLASPDPLMQPYGANLEEMVPVQVKMKNNHLAMEKPVEIDSDMLGELESDLMKNTRPAIGSAETFDVSKRQRQECLACNEAALRIKNDHNTIVTLEQGLRATEEQVANMKVRADAAENRIADYVNELTKVNNQCDAQVAEMSLVLQTQRGHINDIGYQNTRATNELAQCRFDLERHTQLTMTKERELQSANRRIQDLANANQLASQQHRSSLHAAEQMLERGCIKDGSSKAESDRELAEAQINLGKLQNELSEKIRQVAEYDSELQKYKEFAQSAEVDRNRIVIQHNNDK